MMTAFQLKIDNAVRKRFRRIHPKHAAQIVRRLRMLETGPRPHNSIKLKGTKSAYRLTAGEYLILYEIDYDAHVVTVFRIMASWRGLLTPRYLVFGPPSTSNQLPNLPTRCIISP